MCFKEHLSGKCKDNPQDDRTMFANYMSDKGLVSRIYESLTWVSNKKKTLNFINKQRASPGKIHKWPLCTWRGAQHCWSQPQWDPTSHPTEVTWQRGHGGSRTGTRCWWDCSVVQPAAFENSLAIPQMIKHQVTIAILFLAVIQEMEGNILKKNLYLGVYCSICNSQKVDITQMPITWWMAKQPTVYPYGGILCSHNNEMLVCAAPRMTLEHYEDWETPVTKHHIW